MVDLFRKYLQNNISRTELQELMDYVSQPDNRAEMIALIRSALTGDRISPIRLSNFISYWMAWIAMC